MTVKFGSKVGSCSRTGPCKIPAEGIIFHANKYSANYNNLSCAKRGILMEDFVREEGYVIYSYFDVCKKLQEMLIFAMGKTECALKCTRSARHGAAGKAIRTILPHFLNQLPSTRRTSIRGFRYTSLIKSYPGSHVCHPFPPWRCIIVCPLPPQPPYRSPPLITTPRRHISSPAECSRSYLPLQSCPLLPTPSRRNTIHQRLVIALTARLAVSNSSHPFFSNGSSGMLSSHP